MVEEEESQTFQRLRDILLEKEHQDHDQLAQVVNELHEDINTRQRLEVKVDPIVEDKLSYLKNNFPEIFGPAIAKAVSVQIRESQDMMINALYPIMGKLIKKYIVMEITALSEKIDRQLDQAFSWDMWVRRFRAWITGKSLGKEIIVQAMQPTIQEVFVIEQHSSVLLGTYSRQNIMDRDMIAGMMTAIRGFVKEAFAKEHQELETVEYETYKILLKNFQTFYFAVTVSGAVTTATKQKVDDLILDFVHEVMNPTQHDTHHQGESDYLSEPLRRYFSQVEL